MNPHRLGAFIVGGLLFWGVFHAPSAHAQEGKKYGGSLTYTETVSPRDFNPYQLQEPGPTTDRLFTLIYDSLVSYDYIREETQPRLAKDWSVSPKGGPAANQITFKLREDVQWHDGEPLTPEDVKFTYEYVVEKRAGDNADAFRRFGNLVDSVRINSAANTVTFDLVRSTPNPAQKFYSFWVIPEHKFNDSYLPRKQGQPLSESPVGTGPYRYVDKNLRGNIELKSFDEYWGGQAYIAQTEMRRSLDPSTMIQTALGGGTDLIIETPPGAIGRLERSPKLSLKNYSSLSFNAFGYNNNHPILGKKTVRRALTHATDRKSLLKKWYADKGEVIGGPIVPSHPYYNSEVQPLEHDPERARELLREAGYINRDGDGVRETADGEELRFQLVTLRPQAAQSTVRQNVAKSYASQLAEVGVDITIENKVAPRYEKSKNEKSFEIIWVKWEFDPSYDVSNLFLSSKNVTGGDNIVNYSNQKVDNLIRQFNKAKDPAAKRTYIGDVQEIIAEDAPYTFLYTVENYATIRLSVITTRIDPYYFFSYYDDWYIQPGMR